MYVGGAGVKAYPKCVNCLFHNNFADGNILEPVGKGGAAFCADLCDIVLTNCTLVLNSATSTGAGGLHHVATCPPPTPPRLFNTYVTNCIFWGNHSPQMAGLNETLNSTVQSVSGVQGICTDVGQNSSSDPLFANFNGGDFRLSAGSPAIDSGRPGSFKTKVTFSI